VTHVQSTKKEGLTGLNAYSWTACWTEHLFLSRQTWPFGTDNSGGIKDKQLFVQNRLGTLGHKVGK